MRALRALALVVLSSSLASAGVVTPVVRPASLSPLAALGGMLSSALSAPLTASPLPALPASLDASKAQVLVARAAALPAAPSLSPAVASVEPRRLLEAVNATLKDVPVEELRTMPAEELQHLAAAVFDGAGLGDGGAALGPVAALSRASLARVKSALGKPTSEKLLNPGHTESHGDLLSVSGVPPVVREVPSEGRVFRHYTTAEGLKAILSQGALWNGFLPYVQLAPGVYRKDFKDLTGVFLTERTQDGRSVGVPAKDFPFWVDLILPAGLPLLEVEKGAIYLVPLPARTRAWVADLYRRWVRGEELKPHEKGMIERLDGEGGPGPDLSLPVKIVGHGRAS